MLEEKHQQGESLNFFSTPTWEIILSHSTREKNEQMFQEMLMKTEETNEEHKVQFIIVLD